MTGSTPQTILFCTVGSSHQPVITAIRQLQPQHVVFFCTDNDPATGKAGSRVQVEGKGLCIRATSADDAPTLPNIPTQCELPDANYTTVLVPADHLDEACDTMRRAIATARAQYPEVPFIADYTGGTKSMTAALVLAALDEDDVALQIVTGARADLVKVFDGTQTAAPAAADAIRLQRAMSICLSGWSRFAYDEAAEGLNRLRPPANSRLRAQWQRACDLSCAFGDWDRFDHRNALQRLQLYASVVARDLGMLYESLTRLATGEELSDEGLRLWDLWQNARRRAATGRYDDAVARVYRLLEWTAQWILRAEKNWRTDNLPAEIACAAGIAPGRDGRYQAGLFAAWGLVAQHCSAGPASFFRDNRDAMLDHVRRRNESILAHGFMPVSAENWRSLSGWLEDRLGPLLRDLLAGHRIRQTFPQLPDRYLWGESVL